MPRRNSRAVQARRLAARRRITIGAFGVAATIVIGLAAFLVVNPLLALRAPTPAVPETGDVRRVVVTMAGFEPGAIRVPAGAPFAVHLVNPDSPYHTDGGGWHQFRIERLNVDVRVPPRSERTQVFAGLAAGTYEFYCDVCCGGKESPAMRGVIEVT